MVFVILPRLVFNFAVFLTRNLQYRPLLAGYWNYIRHPCTVAFSLMTELSLNESVCIIQISSVFMLHVSFLNRVLHAGDYSAL